MPNLPSHEQLQDDPFGFRSASATRDKQESGSSQLPDTVGQDDQVTLPASRTPLSVDPPPQAQPAPSYVFPRPLVSYRQDGLNKLKEINDASAIVSGIKAQKAQDASLAANPARRMGLSGDNAMLVAAADTINRGNNRAPLPSSVVTKNIETPISVPVVDARNNAPMPVLDPSKTIAKGRTLGPGLTLSQTESGEVAAFGPDGNVVDLKDKGVRGRFGLPTKPEHVAGYGKRADGTEKGSGYLGELKMTDGSGRVMTELGVGVNINGKEVEIPTVVPTLSKQELSHLLSGGEPTPEIIKKAADHARTRLAAGLSPFANSGDVDVARRSGDIGTSSLAPKTANPGTVLSESRPSPLARKQLDVYNADRANGYAGRRDYISPFLTPDQQRARQNEIYAQRQADREAIAQRLATENTIADLESQRTGVPTTSARNRSMLPTSERVMGERQDRAAAEQVATHRSDNLETAKLAVTEKDSSMRDATARRGQDIEDEISRRTAQDNAENRKAQERIAQINAGSKTQRDYQREAMLKARSEAINAALSSDPKSVESPGFKEWLDETYPLMTPEERLELEKQGASAPDPKKYK